MTDTIANDTVVSFLYTLQDENKKVLDSSQDGEPLAYLHGHGQIIKGLETALMGKKVGDKLQVSVSPEDGYGQYDESLVSNIEKKRFPKGATLEVGAGFQMASPDGHRMMVQITAVQETTVTINANHPLAGVKLLFDVEIVGIRPATKEELEHGHAHSGDGHHH